MEKKMTAEELFGLPPSSGKPVEPTQQTEPKQESEGAKQGAEGQEPTEPKQEPEGAKQGAGKEGQPQEPDKYETVFGEKYKDAESIKTVLNSYEELQNKLAEAETKVKYAENPFVNEDVFKLNHLMGKGYSQEVAFKLATLNKESLSNMSDIDVLVLQEVLDTPDFMGKEGILFDDLNEKYSTGILSNDGIDDDEEGYSQEEIERSKRIAERNKIHLKRDANKAREAIIGKLNIPEMADNNLAANTESKKVQQQESEQLWKQVVPEVVKQHLDTLTIPSGEWDKELMKYQYGEGHHKELEALTHGLISTFNIPATEEGMKLIFPIARAMALWNNLPHVVSSIVSRIEGSAQKEAEQRFSVPSAVQGGQKPFSQPSLDHYEKIEKQQEELFPTNRR